jgi:ABC-type transport system substrate-binding protein
MWLRFIAGLTASVFVHAVLAANPADPNKILRTAFQAGDDGFDMAHTTNYYSGWIADAIFEPLVSYDYMARPVKLVGKAAKAVPVAEDGGKSYTFHIRQGVYFSPDPAFKGVRRELTAQDFEYTIKRIIDPQNRAPSVGFIEGKIVGLDALANAAQSSGKFDYDARVSGLQVLDRYTLKITLLRPDHNFLYYLAYNSFSAVAREVVEAYGTQIGQHPVGTGPYVLAQYVPRSKIVLLPNPEFAGFTWNFTASDAGDDKIVAAMKGKQMPQIGRIEISIIDEDQPRWLGFQDQQIDIDMLPQTVAPIVIDGDKLKKEFVKKGVQLFRYVEPEVTYTQFNMQDPVVGGLQLEKVALRRAVAMAYSDAQEILQLRKGQAVKAQMVIPQGILGYDPTYRSSIGYDIGLANKLLDRFGYKRGADGIRTLPDGKPLLLKIRRESDSSSTMFAEIWKRGLDQLGIAANHEVGSFADNLKEARECKLMMWGGAWLPDIPDGENFLQLLYGKNIHRGNYACYQSPAFDALYEKAVVLPAGPERFALYLQMNRQIEADTPWSLHISRIRNWVAWPWVKGFKKHPVLHSTWQFMDIEKH